MARRDQRHPEGVAGEWYVDERCIGCGSSYAVAPTLIRPASDGRFVFVRQPDGADEVALAQQAAEVCPTRSIGTDPITSWVAHHPMAVADGVWRLGSTAPDTAGGNAFFVARAEGNLLVDGPRWSPRLARWLAERGVAQVLLTHRDDVGAAPRYAVELGAEVVIHEDDLVAAPHADRILIGRDPQEVAPGVVAIATPGHTAGHVMYLLDDGTLFSGDSLSWDPDGHDLWAERFVCWHSWPEQLASLDRLAAHRFRRVVPTHGAISPDLDPVDHATRLRRLVATLRAADDALDP